MAFFGPSDYSVTKNTLPKLPFNCFQFMTSQRALSLLRNNDLPENLRFYVHAPFNYNLAQADQSMQLKLQTAVDSIRDLPGSYVFHIGRCTGWKCSQCEDMQGKAGQKIEAIAEMVNSCNFKGATTRHPLLLENAAGQNSELGSTLESQRKLFEALDQTAHIAFCEDTQHRFASGSCDFDSAESVDALFEELFELGRVGMIHLNDSKVEGGRHVDRHEHLTHGAIWSLNTQERAQLKSGKPVEKLESLARVLDWAEGLEIDCISETGDYLADLRVVAQIFPNAI